ncbi:MAG: hypothetical protein ACTHN0_13445 [Aquihabitans sp.]
MPATSPDPRRLRARRALAGCAVALTVLGVGACSSPAPSQRELSEALVDSGLSKKVADCTASALTDSLTENELAELTERGAGGAPVDDPKKDDDSYDKLQKAMTACRDLQAQAAPTTTVASSLPEGGTSTTVTIADGTDGAELNPASTTTTAAP